jgi:peptidoglycan/xylan/chitin deacetylase (PgdA/CDA1 family)
MWARVLKGIRLGLTAVMVAGLPVLYIGPPHTAPALAHAPVVKAASIVADIPPAMPIWECAWRGLDRHAWGLAAPAFLNQENTDQVETLKTPIPIIPAETAYREDGIKRAYLTFDDGPTPGVTEDILNTLDAYGVKATFFVVGRMAVQYSDLLRRIHSEGHTVGNHSYTHSYCRLYSGVTAFRRDLARADALIRNELDDDPRLYRFPGGINWPVPMGRFMDACAEEGYCHVEWNALNGDAEQGGGKSVDELMERLIESCAGKEDVIVLMHDSPGKETTAQALPHAIEYLWSEGYQLCLLR